MLATLQPANTRTKPPRFRRVVPEEEQGLMDRCHLGKSGEDAEVWPRILPHRLAGCPSAEEQGSRVRELIFPD